MNNIHERLSKELEDLQNSGSLIQIESVLNSIRGLRSGFMSNTEYFDRNQQTALKKINSYLLNAETISEDRLKSGDSFIDFIDENFENQLTDEAIEKDLDQAVTPSKLKNPIKEKL